MSAPPKKERKNSDSVPLSTYLLRVGVLVQVTEHGRAPLVCELTKRFNPLNDTFEVWPLGHPMPVTLHLGGVKDVRFPKKEGSADGLSFSEVREIKRRQKAAYEAAQVQTEPRGAVGSEPDEIVQLDELSPEERSEEAGRREDEEPERRAQVLPATPRGCDGWD